MCPAAAETFEQVCAEIDDPVVLSVPESPLSQGRRTTARARRDWDRESRLLPAAVARMLEHVEVAGLRLEALSFAEETVCWSVPKRSLNPAKKAELWTRAWSRRPVETAKAIHKAIDHVLRTVYIGRLVEHEVPEKLPRHVQAARVVNGVLAVDDPERRRPSLGVRSYAEATPPEIVVVTVKVWQRRRAASKMPKRGPRAWDLTSGSNTVADAIKLLAGSCVSTDLTQNSGNARETATLDARRVGCCTSHGAKPPSKPYSVEDTLIIARPDLIFFDPPSRGSPTQQELDLGVHQHLDLAILDREEWVMTVADIASRAVRHLSSGGLMSLLVREGIRNHQHVTPEPGVADEVLAALGDNVTVVGQHRVEFGNTRNQASLIQNRLPMRHLLLARRAS